jgi:hypothetical protein
MSCSVLSNRDSKVKKKTASFITEIKKIQKWKDKRRKKEEASYLWLKPVILAT